MNKKLFSIIFIMSFIINYAQNKQRPLQIADQFDLNLTASTKYQNNTDNGIVYTKTFTNKGSGYIKLHLNSFDLQPGDFLKVYSPITQEEFIYAEKGKIVGVQKEMISEFWTGTIWSDTIIIELHAKTNNSSYFGFNIDEVAYGYSQDKINEIAKKLDTNDYEAICTADDKEQIACYDGTEMGRKAEAVCRLLINGGSLCTGWLLGCDGSLMTNNHCIGDAAAANNTDFLFNYQRTDCAGTIDAASDLQATSANFIQTDSTLDFTLVQLPVNPTVTYGYLSLSSVAVTTGERIYIPQHPAGRRKEIAVVTDIGGDANGFAMVTNAGTGVPGVRVEYLCDTEGGSSGSPVLRFQDNLVVAIHNTGGCPNGSRGRSDQLIAAIGANMPNCGVDDNNPDQPFVNSTNVTPVTETTNCNYQDINLTVRIAQPASNNADVTLSVTGGTATNNDDFELLTPNVTFPANNGTDQIATLRVYNDAFVEGEETIEISLALNANGGDAQLGPNDTFNIVITDNDYNPNIGSDITLFTNDFENGAGDFTISNTNTTTDFAIGNNTASSSQYFNTAGGTNATNYMFVNDDSCNCDMSEERFAISNAFDFTDIPEVYVNFDHFYVDDNSANYNNDASLQVSTDNGMNWTTVGGDFASSPNWAAKTIDLTAYAGQNNVMISFLYSDTNLWSYGLAIDNLTVTGKVNASVQTSTNSVTSLALASTGTIHTYDTASTNIMSSITNNDGFNYGCIDIAVTRSGNGGQSYNGSVAPDLVTDKTFTITAQNNTTSGDNTIQFYFTESEISGWETVANPYTRNDFYIVRDTGTNTETVMATLGNYGDEVTLTATFTGVEGTYYFGSQNTFLSIIENETGSLFSISPNPVNNYLSVNYVKGNLPNEITIYNMIGQKMMNKNVNSTNDLIIDTSNISTGMYFISIKTENANQTFKFIKK